MKTNKSEESRIILFNIRAPFFLFEKLRGQNLQLVFYSIPIYSRRCIHASISLK